MDIHQLQLFLAVMESPSMTRAAEKIHLSPGAVSLQLHNLADELNTELFVRKVKSLIPTPAAVRLAEMARQDFSGEIANGYRRGDQLLRTAPFAKMLSAIFEVQRAWQ